MSLYTPSNNGGIQLLMHGGSATDHSVWMMVSETFLWSILPVTFENNSNNVTETATSLNLIRSGHTLTVYQEKYVIVFGGKTTNPSTYLNDVLLLTIVPPAELSKDSHPTPTAITDKGADGCSSSQQCAACEGDCDTDNDCQDTLQCFQRTTSDATVPGCSDEGK